jgi:hypothetical protein
MALGAGFGPPGVKEATGLPQLGVAVAVALGAGVLDGKAAAVGTWVVA